MKNPPAMQEMRVWSLGWKDPLEEGMATHASILAWRSHGQRSLSGQQSMGSQRIGHDWVCKNKKEKLSRLRRSHNHTSFPALLLGLSHPLEVGNFPQHPPAIKKWGPLYRSLGPTRRQELAWAPLHPLFQFTSQGFMGDSDPPLGHLWRSCLGF